jgi:hypothetical protein
VLHACSLSFPFCNVPFKGGIGGTISRIVVTSWE